MNKAPRVITPATLDVIVMPNGEVICFGKTIGSIRTLGSAVRELKATQALREENQTLREERDAARATLTRLAMPASTDRKK